MLIFSGDSFTRTKFLSPRLSAMCFLVSRVAVAVIAVVGIDVFTFTRISLSFPYELRNGFESLEEFPLKKNSFDD